MENESKIEFVPTNVVEAQSRAEIDIQIATANRYPRNISRAIEKSIAQVSKKEVAEVCIYSLPRAGKSIKGASVHLARIVAGYYSNLRIDSRIVEIGDTMLTAQSVCIDLENNFAVRVEVKRRITDKKGQRYNEDMIVTTANAAMAIASRNAILQVIPRNVIDEVYKTAEETIIGDVSTAKKLMAARQDVIQALKDAYNVTESQILKAVGVESVKHINNEKLLDLHGLVQALRDGDTTVEQAFNGKSKSDDTKKKAEKLIKESVKKTAKKPEPKPEPPPPTEPPDKEAEPENTKSPKLPL